MAAWLEAGAQIPDDPELATDLTSPQYGYSSRSQVQLERKEDMKSRGLAWHRLTVAMCWLWVSQ